MRLLKPENNNVLNSCDNSTVNSGVNLNIDGGNTKTIINDNDSCYRCRNCDISTDSVLKFSNVACTMENDIMSMKTIKVEPIVIRKTPKFPSRERHMAIRRKKCSPIVEELNNIIDK